MARVLVIDDDPMMSRVLIKTVARIDHQADSALTLKKGLARVATGNYDVVILDVGMPDGNGLNALQKIRNIVNPPEVIIITGMGDPEGAELAIKNGAWDYLQKPLSVNNIKLTLKRVLQYRNNLNKNGKGPTLFNREGMVGGSTVMKSCYEHLALAAGGEANVLITGETGTGKELSARAIHKNSQRDARNFVVVDCAALPSSLIESTLFGHCKGAFTGADKAQSGLIAMADGGTLFLDEIGELPLDLQSTFLRVLQEKKFRPVGGNHEVTSDFRLVAATNRDLEQMVEQRRFRSDLLFRLKTVTLELPPLRKRKNDISDLVLHFIKTISTQYAQPVKGFAPDFIEVLAAYDWPGNVRELRHTIESAINHAKHEPILFPKHLPNHIRIKNAWNGVQKKTQIIPAQKPADTISNDPVPETASLPPFREFRESILMDAEKNYLHRLMTATEGRITNACQISNLGRTRLYTLLKKHGIAKNAYKDATRAMPVH